MTEPTSWDAMAGVLDDHDNNVEWPPCGRAVTLTEFLFARIAEDESRMMGASWSSNPEGEAAKFAHRLMADCAAKRRIVDWAAPEVSGTRHENEDGRDLLRILAMPYAAHPDYRPEWVPDA